MHSSQAGRNLFLPAGSMAGRIAQKHFTGACRGAPPAPWTRVLVRARVSRRGEKVLFCKLSRREEKGLYRVRVHDTSIWNSGRCRIET